MKIIYFVLSLEGYVFANVYEREETKEKVVVFLQNSLPFEYKLMVYDSKANNVENAEEILSWLFDIIHDFQRDTNGIITSDGG